MASTTAGRVTSEHDHHFRRRNIGVVVALAAYGDITERQDQPAGSSW
jgi:hypothetical protein